MPFAERGRITDEYVAIMRGLWQNPTFQYDGEHVSFPSMTFEPKCYQVPHIPLWIGGKGPAARRRVAEYGAGWTTLTGSLDELAADIAWMRKAVAVLRRGDGETVAPCLRPDFAHSAVSCLRLRK